MFIKSLVDLDALITAAAKREKEVKKKMNAANAKGLNGMKQKIKKTLRDFDAAVQAYNTVGGSDPSTCGVANALLRTRPHSNKHTTTRPPSSRPRTPPQPNERPVKPQRKPPAAKEPTRKTL